MASSVPKLPGDTRSSMLPTVPALSARRLDGPMSNDQTRSPRILVADDQKDVLEALRLLLKGEGFDVKTVTSPAGLITAVEGQQFDAVLMDLNYTRDTTSGREGLDLLPRLRQIDAGLPVIVDPKGVDYERYKGVSVLTPNAAELTAAAGMPVTTEAEIEQAARKVMVATRSATP